MLFFCEYYFFEVNICGIILTGLSGDQWSLSVALLNHGPAIAIDFSENPYTVTEHAWCQLLFL